MPSVPVRSYSEIFNVLQNLPIFNENGKLKKEKDDVWNDAVIRLRPMKKHNLYLYVQKDRNSIKTNLKKKQNSSQENTDVTITTQKNEIENPLQILNNLHSLKYSVSLNAVITKICWKPFYVIYSLAEQLDLWKNLVKKHNRILSLIVVDGLIERETTRKTNNENRLLYALATRIENNTVLVYQSISEDKTNSFLNFFLREYLRNDFDAPSELVVGYSHYLLDGASKVFNGFSLSKYNLYCYEYLNKMNIMPPYVLIRVDTIDLLKVVGEWDCFGNSWKKKFYMCCIIYLSSLKTLDLFEETVTEIFILCQSLYENKITEINRKKLLTKIQTSHVKLCYEKYLKYASHEDACKIFSSKLLNNTTRSDKNSENPICTYINNLKLQALRISLTDKEREVDDNSYYCSSLTLKLTDLLLDFPVWTDLIIHYSEDISDYVTLNSLTCLSHLDKCFGNHKKVAPDFIKSHWEVLKVSCQEGRLFLNMHQKEEKCLQKCLTHNYLKFEENWMGKNKVLSEMNDLSIKSETSLNNTVEVDCNKKKLINNELGLDLGSPKNINNFDNFIQSEKTIDTSNVMCNIHFNQKEIIDNVDEHKLGLKGKLNITEINPQKNHFGKKIDDTIEIIQVMDIMNEDCDVISDEDCQKLNNSFLCSTNLSEHKYSCISGKLDQSLNAAQVIEITNKDCDVISDEDCQKLNRSFLLAHNYSCGSDDVYQSVNVISDESNTNNKINSVLNKNPITYKKISDFRGSNRENLKLSKNDNNTTTTIPYNTKQCSENISKQSIQTKRSRKYCDAFPAASIYYEQSSKKFKKQPIIRNGTTLPPKVVNKQKYVIRNTSAFDAVVEIFNFGYKNFNCCRKQCNEIVQLKSHETNLINVMVKFSLKSDFKYLYKLRSLILLKYGSKRNDEIFCNDKIGNFLTKILEDNFCFKESLHCITCEIISYVIEQRVLISKNKTDFKIENLCQEVNVYFNNRNGFCLKCFHSVNIIREFGPFLIIDIENLDSLEFLQTIPSTINLMNKTFVLIGVIASVSHKEIEETQYVAYCRSLTNVWYEHNDIKKHVKRLYRLPKIKIALIIYVNTL